VKIREDIKQRDYFPDLLVQSSLAPDLIRNPL
jgi:hypothetical protein